MNIDEARGAISTSGEQADPEALLALAQREQRAGRFAQAEAVYRQLLALRPDAAEVHAALGGLLRREGRLDEAAIEYERAVALAPDLFEAHSGLAALLRRRGQHELAIAQYEQAIARRPDVPDAHNNLGILLCEQGRLAEALPHFRRALELRPAYADATRNLARALKELDRLDEAAALYRQALAIEPRHFGAHFALSWILQEQGKFELAVAHLQQAIALKPDAAEAYFNLGNALNDLGRPELAAAQFERSLALRPDQPAALNNLANIHQTLGQLELAVAGYRRALASRPDHAESHSNLAVALAELGRIDEALTHFDRALALRPDHADAHGNKAVALTNRGQIDDALAHSDRALALRSENPKAHMNRAIVRLLRGEFEPGWAEYEWRWKCEGFNRPECSQPRWQGEPLEGRRILIFTEQGLGDTFQFIRYAKLLKDRGASVLVCAAGPLERLLRQLPYLDGVFPVGSNPPDVDFHLPMLSLPHVFGTTLATIPASEPYLAADPALVDRWSERLAGSDAFKVGINWQGNPKYRGDTRRSVPLRQFAPLARVPGVDLISLQKGYGTEQLPLAGFPVTSLGADLDEDAGPFMDTAAVLKNLDLVITSDTALPHLAGGLGVPTWVALPTVPDWRWMLDRPDSPWYPTMRLFRRGQSGGWERVFEQMAAELAETLGKSEQAG